MMNTKFAAPVMPDEDPDLGEGLTELRIKNIALVADADVYMRNGDFTRAAAFYSQSILIQRDNFHVLFNRAQCLISIGDAVKAQGDAKAILSYNPLSSRGHLCMADALFAGGDFEMAMVWYARGSKLKQTNLERLAQFNNGLKRCRESIEMAMESFDVEKLRATIESKKLMEAGPRRWVPPPKSRRHELDNANLNLDHALLEEIFDDYLFLRELETDPAILSTGDSVINSSISLTLDYLDGRIEFWRARNPRGLHDTTNLDSAAKKGAGGLPPRGNKENNGSSLNSSTYTSNNSVNSVKVVLPKITHNRIS